MALFKIYGGTKEELTSSIPVVEGRAYFLEDTGEFFIDTDTERKQLTTKDSEYAEKAAALYYSQGEGVIIEIPASVYADAAVLKSVGGDAYALYEAEDHTAQNVKKISIAQGTDFPSGAAGQYVGYGTNGLEAKTAPVGMVVSVSRIVTSYAPPACFEFGAGNGEEADAQWFLDLAAHLRRGKSGASLGDIIGKTKTITLTSSVLGTTSHLIRVIGVDQDAPNTVTFQTANCLNNTTVFGSNVQWIGSTARAECQNYYSAFPAKSAIMTVSKGTCPSTNDSRAGTATYNDETVWLPSEREMGLDTYAPISVNNSTNSNAECTQGRNFSYSYYTSNNSRIKKKGDSGSAQYYWERSRYYVSNYSNRVCGVYSDGSASTYNFSGSYGLAPAYVIG